MDALFQSTPPATALLSQGSGQFDEGAFQRGIMETDWYKEFPARYNGELPDLNAKEYDYRKAWAAGIRPERDPYDENFPHWPSQTGDGVHLKSEDHPTMWKQNFMDLYNVNPDSLDQNYVDELWAGKWKTTDQR